MDFIYFFRALFKRKWIILGAGLIAATIAYLLTRNEKKYYKSSTQISTGYTIKDDIGIGDEQNMSFLEIENKFNNVVIISKSDPVVNLLSYKLILHDLTEPKPFRNLSGQQKQSAIYKSLVRNRDKFINLFTDKLEKMIILTAYVPEDRDLLSLLKLYGYDIKTLSYQLRIGRLQRTDYLQIEYLSESPELSAFVVNNLFHQFLRYYISVRDTRTAESIDTLRSIMEKKKGAFDYKRSLLTGEGMVNVELESTSSLERITNLEKTITDEKTRLTNLYYALRKVNQKLTGGASENTTTTAPPATTENPNQNNELFLLKKAMNEAFEAYVNSGSTDKALLNRYNQLKSEYQEKFASSVPTGTAGGTDVSLPNSRAELLEKKSDLEFDIKACEENITSMKSRIGTLKSSVVQDASKAANVETLMKEVELANKEYLDAKQKYTDAVDVSTSYVNNFRQIIFGQPAMEPEPSKKMMVLGMAGVAAMLTAILVIVLLTYLDSSVKTPGIFSKVVNLKLISLITFMNFKNSNLYDLIANKDAVGNRKDQNRGNVFRENLRKLRYEIERSGKKVFLFTSTKKGEGKTTLIQALSFSMSLSKKRVLIIDSNFSNNDLTVQLHAEPVLERMEMESTNHLSIAEKVKFVSTEVGHNSIYVIGSEGGDYTPSEIFPHENVLQHLQEIKDDYDYIFLEGPPLNDFSDSKELAQYVEGVIAVFSATQIIKQIDKESIHFFKELGPKFVGSVLNKVEMENLNVA